MYRFNINGCIKSADTMGDCGANSYQACTFKCLIPMDDLLNIRSVWSWIA